MDQPSVNQVWTFLISETCCYILAEHCAFLFQPEYVDGLLNPSHRTLSFTTMMTTMMINNDGDDEEEEDNDYDGDDEDDGDDDDDDGQCWW